MHIAVGLTMKDVEYDERKLQDHNPQFSLGPREQSLATELQ